MAKFGKLKYLIKPCNDCHHWLIKNYGMKVYSDFCINYKKYTKYREKEGLLTIDFEACGINKAFTWVRTPQGHRYWQDIKYRADRAGVEL